MIMMNTNNQERSLIQFSSGRQVFEECEKILREEIAEEQDRKLFNFRELLSWKMPEHFCSNSNAKQFNKQRVQANEGALFNNQINLYKLDFVTQRLKEQRVNFCGIVCYV